jgi:hypothetical protein
VRRPTAVVVCSVALVALTACPAKKDHNSSAPSRRATTTSGPTAPTVELHVEAVESNGTKAPDDATVAKVMSTLDSYLARAVVRPLATGRPADDISDLFTPEAKTRLGDAATLATLVEGGTPPASRSLTADSAKVTLSSIAGPDEVVALVAARLDVKLHAVGPRIDMDVVRAGELVLAPQADGGWYIDSFGLRTARDTRDAPKGASS